MKQHTQCIYYYYAGVENPVIRIFLFFPFACDYNCVINFFLLHYQSPFFLCVTYTFPISVNEKCLLLSLDTIEEKETLTCNSAFPYLFFYFFSFLHFCTMSLTDFIPGGPQTYYITFPLVIHSVGAQYSVRRGSLSWCDIHIHKLCTWGLLCVSAPSADSRMCAQSNMHTHPMVTL